MSAGHIKPRVVIIILTERVRQLLIKPHLVRIDQIVHHLPDFGPQLEVVLHAGIRQLIRIIEVYVFGTFKQLACIHKQVELHYVAETSERAIVELNSFLDLDRAVVTANYRAVKLDW